MRITHPRPALGRQTDFGVEFVDGVATVESLHPERARALTQHGFTIDAPIAANPDSGSIVDLTSLTVSELRDIAEGEGIELPARARKDEIVDVLSRTSDPIPGATRNDDGSWTIEGEPIADSALGEE